jgi:hypothetical protein
MNNAQDTQLGSYSFRLADPNSAEKPTKWQGPLTISRSGKPCTADVSLVTAVYASPDKPFVVVVSYSGSNMLVDFIDSSTCSHKWPELKVFTVGVQVKGNTLSVLPACASTNKNLPVRCSAGRVYKLSSQTSPLLSKPESIKLTQKVLGVGFEGDANVAGPKTPHPHVVP